MRLELCMKYYETVYRRYRNASKESKARILDELCQVCGYNRKYAIWKLNRLRDKEKAKVPSKRRRRREYGHEVLLIVEKIWKVANCPWSVRLKEILVQILKYKGLYLVALTRFELVTSGVTGRYSSTSKYEGDICHFSIVNQR